MNSEPKIEIQTPGYGRCRLIIETYEREGGTSCVVRLLEARPSPRGYNEEVQVLSVSSIRISEAFTLAAPLLEKRGF